MATIQGEIPFPVVDPERIPTQRYFDEDFYEAELEHLWPHVWQMACRLEQIPDVGDWVEYANAGASIIIVRTNDGVKAFHNACRHRGVPFAGGATVDSTHSIAHGNCAKSGFVCPFHGWRWNMDGENTFVYGKHLFSERQLDADEINLRPCRVETWGGCAFINLDDNAPSFRDTYGPVADRLEAHGVGNIRSEWWFGTVLPANWKTAMEAFMEGYHVKSTHPQLAEVLPSTIEASYEYEQAESFGATSLADIIASSKSGDAREMIRQHLGLMELNSVGMAGMHHAKEVEIARELAEADLPDDPAQALPMWYGMVGDEITRRMRERGENVPDVNAVAMSDPVSAVEFCFPHYFMLPVFTSMSSYRIRPLGPEHCLFELWSLTHVPEGEEHEVPMEPTMLAFDSAAFPAIPRQDYSNIPIQQKGMHSKGFEFMRLSKYVEGLVSNYHRIIDGHLKGVDQGKLAKATNVLGGGFDGPIKEFDF
ncbi:MAG: aromatic ring-hydroxylating dioxygenase subunit alpha [Novosphingobium sp.]|nr:aromatic ring-hydroxylating dioxygenase subunit alpha [Novosphingobium sp.]